MEFFEKAATVRLKGAHQKFLWADNDKSVFQQRAADNFTEWTVEQVSGGRAIRLKSIYNLYLTATDFAFLLGLTGKKVQQSYAAKADSAVEWEPILDGKHVKLRTKRGTYLRANGGIPPYRNSVTHDTPRSPSTQHWILWEVQLVKPLAEERLLEESSIRLPSSFKEKEPVSISQFASVVPKLESLKKPPEYLKKPPESLKKPPESLKKAYEKPHEVESLKKAYEVVSDEETTESEEEVDIPSSRTQVPPPAKHKEDLASRGHESSSDDGNHVSERSAHSRVEQPERSDHSTSETEENSEVEEESFSRHTLNSITSRQKEHLAPKRNIASADGRGFSQWNRQAPPRRHQMYSDDGGNRARPPQSSRRRQQNTYDEPRYYQDRSDDEEQMTQWSRHGPRRRTPGLYDDRMKGVRMRLSPPRRDEGSSYERERSRAQRMVQSPSSTTPRRSARVDEERDQRNHAEEGSRRQRMAQSPPRTSRRAERLTEERDQRIFAEEGSRRQRMVQSPPATPRRIERLNEERRNFAEERSRRQRMVQSPPTTPGRTGILDVERDHRTFAEEGGRRQSMVQSPPTTPRRTERLDEEMDQRSRLTLPPSRRNQRDLNERGERERMAESPPRTHRRAPDDTENRRRIGYGASKSSSDEGVARSPPRREPRYDAEEQRPRSGWSPPRREPKYDVEEQRPRRGGREERESESEQRPRRREVLPRREATPLNEEEENPWAKQSPSPGKQSLADDGDNSSRRSSLRGGMRRIFFSVVDEDDESAAVDDQDWGVFLFEGKTLRDLKEELLQRTGIDEDIFVCVRMPTNGKLSVLKLNLPPINGPMHVEVVRVNSEVGRALAKPRSVRTRQSREDFDF